MTMDNQRVESLEEIVFKTRNKDYGAYLLRKKYRKYTTVSLIIGILAIGAAVAYPVVAAYLNKSHMIKEDKSVGAEMLDIPKEELPPPPPPPRHPMLFNSNGSSHLLLRPIALRQPWLHRMT
jgi:periplasmic protein TonB